MFQCIIQQRNGWIHAPNPELKDVFPDIRLQLNEQLRCLDMRMEVQVALVQELQDFFRRRGELELDYSKNLDKLAKSLQLRHKEQKQKREQWPLFSSFACWQQLVSQTRNLSRDHAALSEIYSTHLVSRLNQVMEDVQRIYRRCREIGYETHEEILRVLHELHTTMKTYHSYQSECRQAESKLRLAENQRGKLEQSLPRDKLERSKKYRLIEKEVAKRKNKYTDAKLKALKARNEYILCLEASNTTIHKYFVDDLSDLIDCMDFGFHNCISRALLMHVSAEEGRQKSVQSGMDSLTSCISSLDSRLDKQRFLESNHQAFMIPKKLEFQGQRGDESTEPELQKVLHQEMETRLCQLRDRVTTLRAESEEVWKTLETAESTLLDMLSARDYDCSHFFGENAISIPGSATSVAVTKPPETLSIKLRADRHETEEFYLSKFREYLLGTTRIARLDAKQEYIRQSLATAGTSSGGSPGGTHDSTVAVTPAKPSRRKRIGRLHISGQPKLFGGSLEEYLESTNQEIPLIVKSCIRVINLYGLHHQGIFRVSGSQVEINNFREWFERGEDPLADMTDASDINSVAGVLKLYLRELREPLFPIIYFEHFMELAQLESKHEFVTRMRELIQSLPRPVVIVMRYLFAFLNHLSEFSDENMMDPYNLAICFGPTLVPVPDDKDQVQYQNQVNELIKNIIMFNEEIFQNDGGVMYEKYISQEPEDNDVGDSPSDHVQDDMDSEVYPSEDEYENMEATAQFDFIARSDRELSLKKGDTVILYTQVSNDWWRGAVSGQEGLIPDKYISLKMKDEEREKHDNLKSSSSEESMRRRASSSNDSVLSESSSASNQHSPFTQCSSGVPDTVTQSREISESTTLAQSHGNVSSIRSQTISTTSSSHKSLSSSNLKATSNLKVVSTSMINVNVDKYDCEDRVSLILDSLPADGDETEETSEASPDTIETVELRNPRKSHWKSQSVSEVVSTQYQEETNECNVSFNQNRELWQKRASSQSINHTVPATKLSNRHSESWVQRQKHTPDLVMDLPLIGNSSPKETTKNLLSVSSSSLSDTSSSSEDDASSIVSLEPATGPAMGPESPDMSTAAERFAKQNQCTLKKNTKVHVDVSEPEVISTKPIDGPINITAALDTANSTSQDTSKPLITRSPVPSRVTHKFVAKFADMHLTGSYKPQVKVKPQILRKPVLPPATASPEFPRKEQ